MDSGNRGQAPRSSKMPISPLPLISRSLLPMQLLWHHESKSITVISTDFVENWPMARPPLKWKSAVDSKLISVAQRITWRLRVSIFSAKGCWQWPVGKISQRRWLWQEIIPDSLRSGLNVASCMYGWVVLEARLLGHQTIFWSQYCPRQMPYPSLIYLTTSIKIYTRARQLPPSSHLGYQPFKPFHHSEGCIIHAKSVINSVIGNQGNALVITSIVNQQSLWREANYSETLEDMKPINIGIGRNVWIENAIIDKEALVLEIMLSSKEVQTLETETDYYTWSKRHCGDRAKVGHSRWKYALG